MWISIAWAIYGTVLMIIALVRKSKPLRYIASGLFAILLCKVLLTDTENLRMVYRIVISLATGVTLTGVWYLYRFGKKKMDRRKDLI